VEHKPEYPAKRTVSRHGIRHIDWFIPQLFFLGVILLLIVVAVSTTEDGPFPLFSTLTGVAHIALAVMLFLIGNATGWTSRDKLFWIGWRFIWEMPIFFQIQAAFLAVATVLFIGFVVVAEGTGVAPFRLLYGTGFCLAVFANLLLVGRRWRRKREALPGWREKEYEPSKIYGMPVLAFLALVLLTLYLVSFIASGRQPHPVFFVAALAVITAGWGLVIRACIKKRNADKPRE
jgi:hypothetical protein